MKKMVIVILTVGLSFSAFAQQSGFISSDTQGNTQGGFKGPAPGTSSIAQIKTLRDNTWVVLEGSIIKQIGHEIYEFRDNSGSISVDIDDNLWLGQSVSPKDKIRIEGEIDKDWNSVEIDVKSIHVIK
ncbi:YgiW/YdeI family stress tolerance OB fold protein [Buttiauxella ferragutiae]|uniref:YgiW/YdeI family stress tolerance OB fold protein n=1 Tax=Buttiauxella ferragutiae TaxID=82989 RepID=UPI0035235624